LLAIAIMGTLYFSLPGLLEPQELGFEAFSTIEAMPREAEHGVAEIYQAALRLATWNPSEALDVLVETAANESNYSNQARDLSNAIRLGQLQENEAYTFTLIGQTLAGFQAWDLSVVALERATTIDPEYAEAWAYLGEAYFQTGDLRAIDALEKGAAINPLSFSVNLFQAFYWQRAGNFDQAYAHLQIAHLIEPEDPQLLVELGRNQVLNGKVLQAQDFYERAIALEPENPIWWKELARYSLDNEILVGEIGLPAALEAQKLVPRDAEANFLIAKAYWQLGENQVLVLQFLNASLSANEFFGEANLLKSIIHLENGESAQAQMHLELVLKHEINVTVLDQAQSLLDQFEP